MIRFGLWACALLIFLPARLLAIDGCWSYYEDRDCDYFFDEDDPAAPPSTGCLGCEGSVCQSRQYAVWQNSTSQIAWYSSVNCGYHLTYVGTHACRIYYECPELCTIPAGSSTHRCQNPYSTGIDGIGVFSQGGTCEEEGYGCSG